MTRSTHVLRWRPLRAVRARPRLFIATLVAVLVGLWLPAEVAHQAATRWLLAWNSGAWLYVGLAAVMMTRSTPHGIRHRAQLQDDGKWAILVLVVLAALASLGAIAGELTMVKDLQGAAKLRHVALAGLTVMSSWAFIQIMFTLHYAHDYYSSVCKNQAPGLLFPGDEAPTYGDFFYFAAVIGTSGQTADVSFASRHMRQLGTVHCILAYLFNTTVLALLINIGASLL